MDLPLSGTRILALTQLGAGPYAMMLLGDLGAEVLKIEDPTTGGDEARRVPPFAVEDDSLYFQSLNRNARSVALDLRREAGREVFRRLVAVSDAVYANVRGDLPAKLGLDYASLRTVNPRIVCCVLSGYGRTGPRAAEPAYDYLLQGLAGFMSMTGDPESPPTRCGISIVDFAGGLMSAVGLLAGLRRAAATGVGGDVDVALLDTAVSMLNYLAIWYLNRGIRPARMPDSAHPTLVPSQNFPTRDGYVVVMCMKEKFWRRLAERLGRPDLAEDPRFRTFGDRLAHRDELIPVLKEVFRQRATDEWIELLRGHVPCAPVHDVPEALADPQVRAREMIVTVDHPRFGPLAEVGCPIKIDGAAPAYRPASAFGADTTAVLAELLGMAPAEIEGLRAAGVIGADPEETRPR